MLDDGRPAGQDRVEGDDVLGAGRHQQGDVVARTHTHRMEVPCDGVDLGHEFGVGGALTEEVEGVVVAPLAGGALEELDHVELGVVEMSGHPGITRGVPQVLVDRMCLIDGHQDSSSSKCNAKVTGMRLCAAAEAL